MSVLFIMLPAALALAAIGVGAFILAARRGQFDDLDTPPLRAVFDDDETPRKREDRDTGRESGQNSGSA